MVIFGAQADRLDLITEMMVWTSRLCGNGEIVKRPLFNTCRVRLGGLDSRVYHFPGGKGSGNDREEMESHPFQAQGHAGSMVRIARGGRCAFGFLPPRARCWSG